MWRQSVHCASNGPLNSQVTHVSLKELSERKEGHGHPLPGLTQTWTLTPGDSSAKLANRRQFSLSELLLL